MTSLNVDNATKERFDELKPDDMTQAEFVAECLDAYEYGDDPVRIDTDEIIEDVKHGVASQVEVAAFRGVDQALDDHGF